MLKKNNPYFKTQFVDQQNEIILGLSTAFQLVPGNGQAYKGKNTPHQKSSSRKMNQGIGF